jgi:eukaryotic-like serine/threonine-protein kinase
MSQSRETQAFASNEQAMSGGDLAAGALVGEHVIDGLIAQGGCGSVYAAHHRSLPRRAAIKVLRGSAAASPRMVERFVREVDLVNLLRHPNIVEIHELGQLADGRPFSVMEYLEGTTLDALLRAQGRLTASEALDVLEPVCSALRAAHAAGIVHRDVKASNIFISSGEGRRVVKLLDFGIAKLTNPELGIPGLTSFGHQIGTPTAMAPEQILGEPIDARIDVYALGVLLYRMLTGTLPFRSSDPVELARQHLEEPAPRPSRRSAVSPALDEVVLRCMEKRPEHRFDSVRSLLAALRDAVGRPDEGPPESAGACFASAAGVYVELHADAPGDELDESLADDFGAVLDLAEERLGEEGFTVILVSGSAILAARALGAGGVEDRRAALAVATSLHRSIAGRPAADPRVRVAVCLHVDQAVVRSARQEIVGGAIVRMSVWTPPPGARGLWATPEALRDLPGHDPQIEPGHLAPVHEPPS